LFIFKQGRKSKGGKYGLQMKGKRAIVTGGTAGIGLAIAGVLQEEGVEVTIPGRARKKLDEALATLSLWQSQRDAAFAEALAARGMNLVLVARSTGELNALSSRLYANKYGGGTHHPQC
jgi:short-subunit dehydrogenase